MTITDARVTGDLREATVFYTVYGDDEERAATAAALESAKGVLRSEVGRQTGVRHTPSLTFVADALPDNARQHRRPARAGGAPPTRRCCAWPPGRVRRRRRPVPPAPADDDEDDDAVDDPEPATPERARADRSGSHPTASSSSTSPPA